jgi:hypothetical protein
MNTPHRSDTRENIGPASGSAPAVRRDNPPAYDSGNREGVNRRAIVVPQGEHSNESVPAPSRNIPSPQDGRRMETPRPSGSENSSTNSGSAPAARRDNTPSYRQIVPRQNNERPSVKEPQAPAPSEKPKKEESQPERRAEPRSSTSYLPVNPSAGVRPPMIEYASSAPNRSLSPNSNVRGSGISATSESFRSHSDDVGKNISEKDAGNGHSRR